MNTLQKGDKNKIGLSFLDYGKNTRYPYSIYPLWINSTGDIICDFISCGLTPITNRLANELITNYKNSI